MPTTLTPNPGAGLDSIETRPASRADRRWATSGRGRRRAPANEVARAQRLLEGVLRGDPHARIEFQEAMTTSTFPQIFGDSLDRQMLGRYAATTPVWQSYCRRATVPDFRTVKRFAVDGAEGVLPEVSEGDPYTQEDTADTEYTYSVSKYGRELELTWETMINDDLGFLADHPDRLARAARRSEDRFATELHIDADGPISTFYTSGNGNLISDTLTVDGLANAIEAFLEQTDSDDEPIDIMGVVLEVGPGNWVAAQNILNQVTVDVSERGGTSNQRVRVTNWIAQSVRLVHNPYIPLVASNFEGGEPWFLHADPQASRPAFEIGFLRGNENPDLRVKSSDSRAVGGGEISPFEGNFDDDSIKYRIRHVFGGTRMDPKSSLASTDGGAAASGS